MIFAACSIGTGELILTTRAASLYEWQFFWCVPLIIFCKAIATSIMLRYGTLTGLNFLRKIWEVKYLKWIIPYFMVSTVLYLAGIGAHMGVTAGTLDLLLPGVLTPQIWIGIVIILIAVISFGGAYSSLEKIMTALTLIISFGIIGGAVMVLPSISDLASGLIPGIPMDVAGDEALTTLIGMFGWLGAGWGPTLSYIWWAEEKGADMHSSREKVKLADVSEKGLERLKGWLRIVHLDLSFSYAITFIVSLSLYITGATVLYPNDLHPEGLLLVKTLSSLFTDTIGAWAYFFFLISAFAVLLSSVIGVVDGLSRALKECMVIMRPSTISSGKTMLKAFKIMAIGVPLLFLLLVERPIWLLLLSSMMFAPAIGIIFLVSTYLCQKLPKRLRPHPLIVLITLGISIVMITASLWRVLS